MSNVTANCNYFLRDLVLGACSGNGECVAEEPNEYSKSLIGSVCSLITETCQNLSRPIQVVMNINNQYKHIPDKHYVIYTYHLISDGHRISLLPFFLPLHPCHEITRRTEYLLFMCGLGGTEIATNLIMI